MNIATFPIPILHDLHQGVINEIKEREHHTSQLNIHVEQECVVMKKQLNQAIKDKKKVELDQQRLKEVVETT